MPPFTPPYIESSPRRIRALFGGKFVIDSKQAKLVWEKTYYPTYFFPHGDLSEEYLEQSGDSTKGVFTVVVGGRRAENAVRKFTEENATDDAERQLAGLLKITFDAMDAWFEEEEEVFVHPKDPYKRVDVLQSSRHVRVEVNGVEVANTHKPRLLFETNLHVRTYIPKTDCRLDLLEPSKLTTQCPYKGVANYYHVRLPDGKRVDDIVWWYRTPQPECGEVKGYVAFYDEKVDVWVDGQKQEK